MNNIHKYLQFKLTEDENNNINYLDLFIHRHNNNLCQIKICHCHTVTINRFKYYTRPIKVLIYSI
jgi:hypothetical protein